MATKLEECARAIDDRPWLPGFGGSDATSEALRDWAFVKARAVIRCLMEPDEAMLDAAARQLKGMTFSNNPANQDKAIFRAMLQAVLDEADTAPQIAASGHGEI